MPEDFPLQPVLAGGPSAPVETPTTAASPHPQDEGGFGDVFATAYRQSPIVTAMMRGYGDLTNGNQIVPQDKAASVVTSLGLDPKFIPKGGIGYGALQEEIQRQSEIKLHGIRLERSGGPSWLASTTGSLAAGLEDPSIIVLGPMAGRVAMLARGGLALRAGVGAAEAATYTVGMGAGQAHMTGHDEDILSWQMLHDATFNAALGGLMGAAFGPRGLPPRDMGSHLDMIATLENSAGAAKRLGIPESDVVSKAGAVGRYQIMPDTARQYGFDPARLKDPAYNEKVATAILQDLDKRFNGDREAIAVAYNAGPGIAKKWLAAGKDMSVLPKETQGYVQRTMQMGAEPFGKRAALPTDEARTALSQFAADNDIKPFATNPMRIADEHAQDMQDIESAAYRNIGQPADPMRVDVSPEQQARMAATPARAQAAPAVSSPEAEMYKASVDETRKAIPAEEQENFDEAVKAAQSAKEEGTKLAPDELTKAIETAARCATRKGVVYGSA